MEKYCKDQEIMITSGFLSPEVSIPFPVMYKPFDYSTLEEMIAKGIKND